MLDLFINPWTMVAGAALVSSPIIIHLINRMKFKRVRWAAMEFLLKSQKRNRRKLIIEQLILLMLRCFLIALMGLLLARFMGFDPTASGEARPTLHVVVLDDTPSMSDFWRQEGQLTDSMEQAKRTIVETIATAASQATAAQELQVIRLSDLKNNPRRFDRLSSSTIDDLRKYLTDVKTTPVHVPVLDGVRKAREVFNERGDVAHVLHLVGDFRATDWGTAGLEDLTAQFTELASATAEVHLHDVAHPERKETSKVPLYSENIGIVDLRSETRIAARYAPVEFVVDVANFSNSERKNVRITVKRNGSERAEASANIATLPANQVTSARFTMAFERTGTAENPLERFNLVSATLDNEEGGIAFDNTRYTVVECRERVPILMIEGNPANAGKKEADSYYLQTLFTEPIKGYDVVVRSVSELEKPNLAQYAVIYLLNVRELSDKAAKHLDEYVRGGGGLAFFMGPNVRPESYNKLYADGEGIFPCPLGDAPSEALNEQQRAEKLFSFQMQLFPRDPFHPALERLYTDGKGQRISREEYDKFLRFVVINQYWPVPRLKWKSDPARVQELMTFPNSKPMGTYEAQARTLADRLPIGDSKYEKFSRSLQNYANEIKQTAASSKPLYALGNVIDALLKDQGDPKDAENKPNLQEFWQLAEQAELRQDLAKFLELVRYGDPLYVAKQVGVGRVVAFLTTANGDWNDLDGFGKSYYPPLMIEMQKYLASAGTDVNLTVGSVIEQNYDSLVYSPKVKRALLSQEEPRGGRGGEGASASTIIELGEQIMEPKNQLLTLRFDESKKPGAYLFEFMQKREASASAGGPTEVPEYKALAFNVDTTIEGNLRRIDSDELKKLAPGAKLHTIGEDLSDVLSKKRRDWSESPWLYLVILLVLIAEQAMAVHLSFHKRANEQPITGLAKPVV